MRRLILLAVTATSLTLAACSSGGSSTANDRTTLLVTGSSTVFPFAKAVADRLGQANPANAANVQATGTGPGIQQFCAGNGPEQPDIVGASRRMTPQELQGCEQRGVTGVVELQIGMDGIVFAHSPASPPLQLTRRHIYQALAANPFGQPQQARTWRQIDPALPDVPITVYGPPAGDGTRDSLVELVMIPACESDARMRDLKRTNEAEFTRICTTIRSDAAYVATGEDDERTAMQLVVNPVAMGIFGWSYLERNAARLRPVPIDGVTPDATTIADRRYLAARPLFLYVKSGQAERIAGLRPYLAEFIQASAPNGYLAQNGLIPAPDAIRQRMAEAATQLRPITARGLQ